MAGLAAVYGLVRRTSWGPAVGLTVGAANILAGLAGLVLGWEGAAIGTGISVVAVVLTAIGESSGLRGKRAAVAR
jgi:hypothetical protein